MPLNKIMRSAALATTLLLAGCHETPPQPDYTPVGDGMRAIGICLVVYGVVQALASLVTAEDKKPKDPPPKTRKSRQNHEPKGGE